MKQQDENVNEVGQVIDVEKAACRQMNINELMMILRNPSYKMMSWGAHNFTTNGSKIGKMEKNAMFRMTVHGHHHKGHVYIFLSFLDLFDVYLTTNRGTIHEKIEGLFFDQLVEWIDDHVEKIQEYVR